MNPWHIFEHDRLVRVWRCTPPGLGGTRRPENCEGCGIYVTDKEFYEAWKGDVPWPVNAALNFTLRGASGG